MKTRGNEARNICVAELVEATGEVFPEVKYTGRCCLHKICDGQSIWRPSLRMPPLQDNFIFSETADKLAYNA